MTTYFLKIWTDIPEGKPKPKAAGLTIEREVTQILSFYTLLEVWNYVLENKIEHYSVYQSECVIDES